MLYFYCLSTREFDLDLINEMIVYTSVLKSCQGYAESQDTLQSRLI